MWSTGIWSRVVVEKNYLLEFKILLASFFKLVVSMIIFAIINVLVFLYCII